MKPKNYGDVLSASCSAHGFPAPSMRFHLLAPQGHPFNPDVRDPPANATISDSYVTVRTASAVGPLIA